MLMFRLYIAISSCLVLTYQQDISRGSLDTLHTDNSTRNVSSSLEITSISTSIDTEYETKTISHSKRRTHIWFAVPRSTDNSSTNETECGSSADEFPSFFQPEEIMHGAIMIHIVICIYGFCLIAIVCDQYFIPCVQQICESLHLSEDVAAATFMAIATSASELFVNIIGTFVTQSDIGIGTIIGSSMFNTIGVAAIGGLAAPYPIKIAWWPVTRDVILYIFAITFLVIITWDGSVLWYEALILFSCYFLYFFVMVMNNRISKAVYSFVNYVRGRNTREGSSSTTKLSVSTMSSCQLDEPRSKYVEDSHYDIENRSVTTNSDEEYNIYRLPKGGHWYKAFFIFTWPIRFLAYYTIPDCKKYPRLYPISFVMCIIWIGLNSYVVSWMMTIIGAALGIPDAVLGLTFLAIGGCLPESFSIAILSRRGEGRMGVSNALGANTLNILLSLGLPWFIKSLTMGSTSASVIKIESGSLEYTILGLIAVAFTLYVSLLFAKFHLSRPTGFIMLICYLGFLTLAILADMVLFKRSCV